MPSIAELRAETQPDWLLGRPGAEHWAGRLYMRRLSPYLTRLVLRTALPANGVTALMIPAGLLGALSFTFAGIWPSVVGVLLVQLQLLLDCSDGEVARWRGTSSPVGVYLDRVGHYVAECGITLALGVRVARSGGFDAGPEVVAGATGHWAGLLAALADPALFLGAVLALLVALNKVENDLVHVSRGQAGMLAMKEAAHKAGATLLEPIMKVVVTTPEEFVGNVTGDLNRRRGLIVNSDQRGNTRIVEAEVPLSEMFGYTTELRSMSTGRAASVMEPLKYQEVPTNVRKAILEELG